jgi:hypothetical protein
VQGVLGRRSRAAPGVPSKLRPVRILCRLLPILASVALLSGDARPARADTLGDLAKRLGELRKRVELWIALAEQDPDKDTIARYQSYQEEDFKKKNRVTAEDLFAIVLKKDKEDRTVRFAAGKVLEDAANRTFDPDLAPPKSRGKPSKRAEFAREHLIPWLTRSDEKKGDRWTREIVSKILNRWFLTSGSNAIAISQYNADAEQTWTRAANAWKDVVKDG